MGNGVEYVKFFRFRSSFRLDRFGEQKRVLWLFPALKFIDFSFEILLHETYFAGSISSGAITYQDLCNMPFDLYETAIKRAGAIQSKKNEKGDVFFG